MRSTGRSRCSCRCTASRRRTWRTSCPRPGRLTRSTLPHAFRSEATVCFICPNPKAEYKKAVAASGANVQKVISTKQLREEFRQGKRQKELAQKYDIFVCDARVYHLMGDLLSAPFFDRQRVIPIATDKEGLKEGVERVRSGTLFKPGRGLLERFEVGRFSQSDEQVADNVLQAVADAVEALPNKAKDVRSVLLTSPGMVALPLYDAI